MRLKTLPSYREFATRMKREPAKPLNLYLDIDKEQERYRS